MSTDKCPICRARFDSAACPHDRNQVADRTMDDRIRKIVREELKKIEKEKAMRTAYDEYE